MRKKKVNQRRRISCSETRHPIEEVLEPGLRNHNASPLLSQIIYPFGGPTEQNLSFCNAQKHNSLPLLLVQTPSVTRAAHNFRTWYCHPSMQNSWTIRQIGVSRWLPSSPFPNLLERGCMGQNRLSGMNNSSCVMKEKGHMRLIPKLIVKVIPLNELYQRLAKMGNTILATRLPKLPVRAAYTPIYRDRPPPRMDPLPAYWQCCYEDLGKKDG